MIALSCREVTDRLGASTGIVDFSLAVQAGEMLCILGRSGAGKTRLAKLMAGIITPASGSISLFGASPSKLGAALSVMFNTPVGFSRLTLLQNIKYRALSCGIAEPHSACISLAKEVGIERQLKQKLCNCSKATISKFKVAMALVSRPSFLILDEPFDGLDPIERLHLRQIIANQMEKIELTVVAFSRSPEGFDQLSSRFGILEKGRLVFNGTPEEFERIRIEQARVRTPDPSQTMVLLEQSLKTASIVAGQKDEILIMGASEDEISKALHATGQRIIELSYRKSLTDLYLRERRCDQSCSAG